MHNFLAAFVMFVIAVDIVVFALAGLSLFYYRPAAVPVYYLAYLSIANFVAWMFALTDDGAE